MLTRLISCGGQVDLFDARSLPPEDQVIVMRKVINRIVEEQLVTETIATEVCSSFWAVLTGQSAINMVTQEKTTNKAIPENMDNYGSDYSSDKSSIDSERMSKQLQKCEALLFPTNGTKDFSRAALALKEYVADNTEWIRPLHYGITYLLSNNPSMAERYFRIVLLRSQNPQVKRIAERAMKEYC